jgi:H+/Cl- antiporter ClcA
MQARLEIRRFPSTLLVIVFALVATLVLGAALGYTLKPSSVTSGPPRVIVVPNDQLVNPSVTDSCVFVGKHKGC